MIDNETRLRELAVKAVDGVMSEEEFAELVQLSNAKRMLRESRALMIANIRETLRSQGITIQELFSAEEISLAGTRSRPRVGRVRRTQPDRLAMAAVAGTAGKTPKGPRRSGALFSEGECRTLMQQVLRESATPLTPSEIVRAVLAKKSLSATEEASVRLAIYYVLRKKNTADFVLVDPKAKRARWKVAG